MTDGKMLLWQEFAPSDEELEAYRKGEEWDPKLAEQRRRLKVRLVLLCFSYVCVYMYIYFFLSNVIIPKFKYLETKQMYLLRSFQKTLPYICKV